MLKKFLIGTVVALALLVGVTASAAYDFGTTTVKLGSKGPAVVAVQTVVGAKADGSFGPMTKAKVIAWQASNGLTADGLFGAKSKAVANGGAAVSTTTGSLCPNGMTLASNCTLAPNAQAVALCPNGATVASNCASTPGTTVSSTGEGSLSIQSAPVAVVSSVAQSDIGDNIMAFAVKATGSDVKVQRVNISLSTGTASTGTSALPWKYFTNLYLYQDGTLLGSMPVNSSSLTENTFGKDYTAIFGGLNVTVHKDGTTNFIVKADIVGTIPSSPATYIVGLNDQSTGDVIRGVDGLGLSSYISSNNSWNRSVTFTTATSGSLTVVTDGSNPLTTNVVTSATNVTSGVTGLMFDLQNTSKYDVTIKSLTATLSSVNPNISAYYLYDGASLVASVGNPGSNTLAFTSSNLPSNFIVSANSTKYLTIKFDVAAVANPGNQTISVASSGITAIDTNSNIVNPTGTATGNLQTLQSTGVVVNLVSATSTSVASTTSVSGYSTATFVFTVKANGVNLAKLSSNLAYIGVTGTNMSSNKNYTVSPDQAVSDGSQVTVTLTATQKTSVSGNITFAITGLTFENSDLATTTNVTAGFDNFHTTVYAN